MAYNENWDKQILNEINYIDDSDLIVGYRVNVTCSDSDITLNLPQCLGGEKGIIRIIKVDNTDYKVKFALFSGDTLASADDITLYKKGHSITLLFDGSSSIKVLSNTAALSSKVEKVSGTNDNITIIDNGNIKDSGYNISSSDILGSSKTELSSSFAVKSYVDSFASGLSPKDSCIVATDTNIELAGLQTIQGVSLTAGKRILVKSQDVQINNGIYTVQVADWSRTIDFPVGSNQKGSYAYIDAGTHANQQWACISDGVVGDDNLLFTQISGGGSGATYTAGDGIDITSNTISVKQGSDTSIGGYIIDGLNLYVDNDGKLNTAQDIRDVSYPKFKALSLTDNTNQIRIGEVYKRTTITNATLDGERTLTLPNADSNTIQPKSDPTGTADVNKFVHYVDNNGVQHLKQPRLDILEDVAMFDLEDKQLFTYSTTASGFTNASYKIGNDGTNATVVTSSDMQNYVTQQVLNRPSLPPALFATTLNDTLSGLSARDGYTPIDGVVCLVKNQTTTSQNGVYIVSSGAWTRAFFNKTTNIFEPITTQTLYSDLNITNGIINVNNGNTNKNIQFQIGIKDPNETLSSGTPVTILSTTKIPISSPFSRFVDNSLGNDTNNNGSQSFPFLNISRCFTGASYPLSITLSSSGSVYTFPTTLTNNNVVFTGTGVNNANQSSISSGSSITITANNQSFKNLIISSPIIINGGQGHNFNCVSSSISLPFITFGSAFNKFIELNTIDLSSSSSQWTLDFSTSSAGSVAYINNVRGCRIKIGTNNNVRVFLTNCPTAVFDNINTNIFYSDCDNIIVNSILTSQSQLNNLLADTNTATDGYYTTKGFSPSVGYVGDILYKQSIQGVITSILQHRTYAQTISIAVSDTTYIKTSSGWDSLDSKMSNTLANNKIFIGNSSNIATAVNVSGDTTIDNTGVVTIGANKVTNSKLAKMNANTIKGNNTASSADPTDILISDLSKAITSIPTITYNDSAILSNGSQIARFSLPTNNPYICTLPDITNNLGATIIVWNANSNNSTVQIIGGSVNYILSANQVAYCAASSSGWAILTGAPTNILTTALQSSKILVGNTSNIATAVNMSGDATIDNTGAVTLANNIINTNKIIDNSVTYAKMQQVSSKRLLGNTTDNATNVTELTANDVATLLAVQSFSGGLKSITSNTTLLSSDTLVKATITALTTVTLPDIATVGVGTMYIIYNDLSSTAGAVLNIVKSDLTFTVNITAGQCAIIQSDGTNWQKLLTPPTDIITTVTANATISSQFTNCNATSPITVTLPSAGTFIGRIFKIYNLSTSSVTVSGATQSITLSQYSACVVESNGANWAVLVNPSSSQVELPRFSKSSFGRATARGCIFIYKNQLYQQGLGGLSTAPFGLNNNNYTPHLVPIKNTGAPITGWSDVVYSYDNALALTTSGRIFEWGERLGTYFATELTVPNGEVISSIYTISSRGEISSISYFAISTTGKLYSWGNNTWGQLGINSTTAQANPTLVSTLSGKIITQVSVSGNNGMHVGCLDSTGQAYVLGYGGSITNCNPFGNGGTFTNLLVPYTISGGTNVKKIICTGQYETAANASRNYTLLLKNDGTVLACGTNDRGQLGVGNTTNRNTFAQCIYTTGNPVTNAVDIYAGETYVGGASVIIDSSGILHFSGYSDSSCFGDGTGESNHLNFNNTTTLNSAGFQGKMLYSSVTGIQPKVIVNGTNRYTNCWTVVLDNTGTIWGCGYNITGQFGYVPLSSQQATFVQSIVNTNGAKIVDMVTTGYPTGADDYGTILAMSDGTIMSAGYNTTGALGCESTPSSRYVGHFRYLIGFSPFNKQ